MKNKQRRIPSSSGIGFKGTRNRKQTKYFKLGFDVYVIMVNCQLENNFLLMRKSLICHLFHMFCCNDLVFSLVWNGLNGNGTMAS